MAAVGALVARAPRTKPTSSPVISGSVTSVLSPSLGLWSRSSTSDTIRAPLPISRTHGSGFRVPGHPNLTGEPTEDSDESNMSRQSMFELSPGFHSARAAKNSGSGSGQPQSWNERET